jgi:ABC-2 type transport system ATP-binding protein
VIHQPALLILDEPTAGVDPEERRNLWEKLFELAGEETTILVSTHYMDEAVRCHRLALLMAGRRVLEGSPENLAADLAGRVLEVRSEDPELAVRTLRALPQVASVARLGAVTHVLLAAGGPDAESAAPEIRQALSRAGFSRTEVAGTLANLEDVFVAATLAGASGARP